MSKPRYRWWGYVKAVIRAYPALDKVMWSQSTPRLQHDIAHSRRRPEMAGEWSAR